MLQTKAQGLLYIYLRLVAIFQMNLVPSQFWWTDFDDQYVI